MKKIEKIWLYYAVGLLETILSFVDNTSIAMKATWSYMALATWMWIAYFAIFGKDDEPIKVSFNELE